MLNSDWVRLVCVGDTHNKHKKLKLPSGDVLVHVGDFVGNYGNNDVVKHLERFSKWCDEISIFYKLVLLVAGNHDTPLDLIKYPRYVSVKRIFLESLPSNVVYLEDSFIIYRGLKIYGSPITPCRKQLLGKNYNSNGFERINIDRQRCFNNIPDDLDILLTHVPPKGILSGGNHNCIYLYRRLLELMDLGKAPTLHVFGHDHDYFGVEKRGSTTFMNVAQAELLRHNNRGQPLIFDIHAKDI
jgi:Icc-related predicted phosphoesterase